jgi:hypothetical protein
MKKAFCLGLLAFVVFGAAAPAAFGWGSATHFYMIDLIMKANGATQADELYGCMAPDVFNYMFDNPAFLGFLQDQTHQGFMKVWLARRNSQERPDAYGFVAHNDSWGMDSTAHHNSRTLLPSEGYVISKARALHAYLWDNSQDYRDLALLGVDESTYLSLCHEMVEAAGDVLIAQVSPGLGKRIVKAALRPAKDLQNLLVRAYRDDLVAFASSISMPLTSDEAKALILANEQGFRQSMLAYGTLLQEDQDTIIQGLVSSYAGMVAAYLGALGITLPPGTDISPLIEAAIGVSLQLCQGDYMREVFATKNYVAVQLQRHLN